MQSKKNMTTFKEGGFIILLKIIISPYNFTRNLLKMLSRYLKKLLKINDKKQNIRFIKNGFPLFN